MAGPGTGVPTSPPLPRSGVEPAGVESAGADAAGDDGARRQNLLLLVQLRWIAVVGQFVTIAGVGAGLGVALPLGPMGAVLAGLVALNLGSLWRLSRPASVTPGELAVALSLDIAALTLQLFLTGGATNPFVFLYLLQVTLGAVLLDGRAAWTLAGVDGAQLRRADAGPPPAGPVGPAGRQPGGAPHRSACWSASCSMPRCSSSSSDASPATCGSATRASPRCASAPSRKASSSAWASSPPGRRTNSARPSPRCR